MPASASPVASAQLVAEVIDHGPISARQFVIVGLCLLLNVLDGFDITAMAVVASPVSSELALSPDRLGWIFSFALAGMMAGAMLLAPVSDLIGRRKLILLSVALVGVSILLTARAASLTEFIVLRFVSGLGAGAMLACQAALAAEYAPERYRAAAVAVVTSGYPLGAMMTSVVAGHLLPEYGWRGMFVFGGALTLAMVAVAALLIPESLKYLVERRPHRALERVNAILAKLARAPLAALPRVGAEHRHGGLLENMLKLMAAEHRVATLTLWAAFFLSFSALYFLMSWIPKLMEDSGFSPEVGRDAFFLFNLGGVLGTYLMSWLSIRFRLSNVVLALLVLAAFAMAAFALAPNRLVLLMVLILVIGITQQGGFVGLYSTAAKIYPTAIRSTGIGWAIGLGRSGAVAGPAIAGYLIAAGLDLSANFLVFAVPMAIAGLIAYRLRVS